MMSGIRIGARERTRVENQSYDRPWRIRTSANMQVPQDSADRQYSLHRNCETTEGKKWIILRKRGEKARKCEANMNREDKWILSESVPTKFHEDHRLHIRDSDSCPLSTLCSTLSLDDDSPPSHKDHHGSRHWVSALFYVMQEGEPSSTQTSSSQGAVSTSSPPRNGLFTDENDNVKTVREHRTQLFQRVCANDQTCNGTD